MFNIMITIFLFGVAYTEAETVNVMTNIGVIQGNISEGYNTFFGVPYARVNERNPFGDNLRYPKFEKPFIANDSTVICPQVVRTVGGILQCLRLNIYVPHTASTNNTLPILVWFYGGGFIFGKAGDYGGQHLVKHDIIVITVNYRLGPYGFLCLNDRNVPGNQGLKDQIAALRWVKENIASFGGNASRVTIAGESYGGGAVDLHFYSKYETLFDKAIVQSGSIYTPGFFAKRDANAATKLAIHLGHNVDTTKEALRVLANENPIAVMAATRHLGLKLTACKERRFKGVQNFVTKCLYHLQNPNRIKNITILFGYNSREDFGTFANKTREFYDKLNDLFYSYLMNNFYLRQYDLDALSHIIRHFYLGSKEIGPESMLELIDFASDFKLNYAAERSISRLNGYGAKIYKYLFSYIGGSIYQNVTGVGAMHTDELKYLFELNTNLTSEEQRMIRDRMTTMWANFVKFGNPTPQQTELIPVTWTPFNETTRPYLNIDVNMTMQNYVYYKRMAFWDLFWQKYEKKSVIY